MATSLAQRLARHAVVVDASIAVRWFVAEPGVEAAVRLIEDDLTLLAPDIMPIEAANAWWRKMRLDEMSERDFLDSVNSLERIGFALAPALALLKPAVELSRKFAHPVLDCLYLALALERSAALATVDAKLARVAQRAGVQIWNG